MLLIGPQKKNLHLKNNILIQFLFLIKKAKAMVLQEAATGCGSQAPLLPK